VLRNRRRSVHEENLQEYIQVKMKKKKFGISMQVSSLPGIFSVYLE